MRFTLTLVAFLSFLMINSCSREKKYIKPEYRDVTEAVYSTVEVTPRDVYKVFPKMGGIIEELYIDEGDKVKKGDVLLKISNSTSTMNVENARLHYEIARESFDGESAILKELKEQIETATAKLESDSINYMRQKRLWDQNVGSRVEYDARKLAFEVSKNEVNRLTTLYRRNSKDLERKMEIAKNTVKINQLNKEDFIVKSKMDGLVYRIESEEGESVSVQAPIAVIGSNEDFILSLLIDEVDISKIQEGQRVVVVLDAYPGKTYSAEIDKIYPEKDERSLTFLVEANFISRPDRLLKGLSGEANIIVRQRSNVLAIPSQFISENGQVNTSKGLKEVTVGIRSMEFTEILSGIDSSTHIENLK